MFKLPFKDEEITLGLHKQIYLVLYDIWVESYGQQFTEEQVDVESKRTPIYREAWDWALGFQKPEGQSMFLHLSNIN